MGRMRSALNGQVASADHDGVPYGNQEPALVETLLAPCWLVLRCPFDNQQHELRFSSFTDPAEEILVQRIADVEAGCFELLQEGL